LLEELAQMRRERGSAILFVMIFVVAITTVLIAAASLSADSMKVQWRREQTAITSNAFDGGVDQALDDYAAGTLSLPATRTFTVGNLTLNITVTDNSAVTTKTLKVDGTVTLNGTTYTYTRVVGQRKTPNPLYYALALNNSFSAAFAVTTGQSSANGDVAINGSSTWLLGGNQINGDLETNGITGSANIDLKGMLYSSAPSIPFPTYTRANYQVAATTLFGGGATIGNFTFASAGAGLYKIMYVGGNCSIRGSFTGQGCVYIAGTATVTQDVTYGNASSCVVFIAEGGFVFPGTTANIAG
jgi:hypothetical protein